VIHLFEEPMTADERDDVLRMISEGCPHCGDDDKPATDLLTPAQLAAKYPVSLSTLYSACKDGLIPHYRVPARKGRKGKGKYLIKEEDFVAWLEKNKLGGEEEKQAPPPTPVTTPRPRPLHIRLKP
jgi:excisionase family DNA binding protein